MIPVRIGALLIQQQIVIQDQVEQALDTQIMAGGRLGTNLVELGFATVADIGCALSKQHGVPVAEPEAFLAADLSLLGRVPPELCKRYMVFPLALEGDELHLAMMDPRDQRILERLLSQTGQPIRPYVAPELRLLYFLEKRLAIPRAPRFLRVQIGDEIAAERRQHLKPTVGPNQRRDDASDEIALPPPSSVDSPRRQAAALTSSLEQEIETFFRDTQPPISREPSFELDITVEEPAEVEAPSPAPQPVPGLEAVSVALEQAIDRGEVTRHAVQKVYAEVSLAVLFLIRGEMAVALSAGGSPLTDEQIQGLVLSFSSSALLQRALDLSTIVIAEAGADPAQQQIAEYMRVAPPGQACIVPISIGSRPVNLLCLQTTRGNAFPPSAPADLALLGERIGAAYLRLIHKTKSSPR